MTEAQCSGDFTFSVKAPATPDGKGKIELLIDNPAAGTYSFKIYKMEGTLTLVETKTASSPRSISFEGLEPSAYFVKIEWGDGCYRTIGGFDGIIIATTKDRE